jgi:hypothetical protein
LVTVTVVGLLLVPTPTAPKLITAGVASIAPTPPPVPLNDTVVGFATEVEFTVRTPVTAPLPVG